MTKIDIISGFLGAGKTTLIKKLLSEAFAGEQVVLIENEFGEIGIDGGFLKESGIEIREMNSGCICCSLVGDFGKSLREVVDTYHPDRILIEPSGVGKLSDVIKAVQDVQNDIDAELNSFTTVVDATKCRIYRKNFGEFFSNQIEYAGAVILSRRRSRRAFPCSESSMIRLRLSPLRSVSSQVKRSLRRWSPANLWRKNFSMRSSARSAVIIMKKASAAGMPMIMPITTTMTTITRNMSITTIIMIMQVIIMLTMCLRAGDARRSALIRKSRYEIS